MTITQMSIVRATISAQIKNVEIEKWNEIFVVGQSYFIKNFEVENNSDQYTPTNYAFKINIVKATKITPHEMPDIPESMYIFTMFDAIVNSSVTPDCLICTIFFLRLK